MLPCIFYSSADPSACAARFFVDSFTDLLVVIAVHNPGENMRVAYRRSDGGWEFGEPAATSPPPTTSFDLMRETTLPSSKEKQLRPGELTTRGYVEDDDADGVPPPAYDVAESSVGTEAPR